MSIVLSAPLKRALLGIALGALVIGAFWAYGESKEALGASKERERAQQDAFDKYVVESKKMADAGDSLTSAIAKISEMEPRAIERYKYVKQKSPLPVGCRPGDQRLRSISGAIDAANALAGHGAEVRTGNKAEKQ